MVSDSLVHKSVVIDSSRSAVERLCSRLLEAAAAKDFDGDDIFAIHLALEEALLNAIQHGNKQNTAKQIRVEYFITPAKFEISITDEGPGFNPDSVPDPRAEENLRKCCGRGLLLMRSYMDEVEYNEAGNCVHMVKHKTKAPNAN
ncbi:MAG: ATP-binding protein [Planctomycetota bacterium]|nr:MAG: ATP-binding protein [Planctomycetota bacterium]